jgi:hypothetical protein
VWQNRPPTAALGGVPWRRDGATSQRASLVRRSGGSGAEDERKATNGGGGAERWLGWVARLSQARGAAPESGGGGAAREKKRKETTGWAAWVLMLDLVSSRLPDMWRRRSSIRTTSSSGGRRTWSPGIDG